MLTWDGYIYIYIYIYVYVPTYMYTYVMPGDSRGPPAPDAAGGVVFVTCML